jgi:hypothetical protein
MKNFANFSTGKLLAQHETKTLLPDQALAALLECLAARAPVHKAFRRVDVVGGRSGIALVLRTGDDRVLRTSRALEPLLKPALRESGAIAGQISA